LIRAWDATDDELALASQLKGLASNSLGARMIGVNRPFSAKLGWRDPEPEPIAG